MALFLAVLEPGGFDVAPVPVIAVPIEQPPRLLRVGFLCARYISLAHRCSVATETGSSAGRCPPAHQHDDRPGLPLRRATQSTD